MNNYYWILICIIIGATIIGCERTVPITPPPYESVLVVNGFIEADKPWDVFVSQSQSYYQSPDNLSLQGIKMQIISTSDTIYPMPLGNSSLFTSDTILPQVGEMYLINAFLTGFPIVSAKLKIPCPGKIEYAEIADSVTVNSNGQFMDQLSVYILDPQPDIANYFFLYFFALDTLSGIKTPMEWQTDNPMVEFSSRLAFPDRNNQLTIYQDLRFFSDKLLNDSIFKLDFFLPGSRLDFIKNYHQQWVIRLGTTDSAFYKYYQTFEQQKNTFSDPFSEPTPVYTNIEGGLGIWAGFATDSFTSIFE
ncbi:MAG: DUF4249 family protein [Bacteroidia bacterium]